MRHCLYELRPAFPKSVVHALFPVCYKDIFCLVPEGVHNKISYHFFWHCVYHVTRLVAAERRRCKPFLILAAFEIRISYFRYGRNIQSRARKPQV